MDQEISKQKVQLMKSATIFLWVGVALLAIFAMGQIKGLPYIGGGVPASSTISVSGEGDAVAVPDVALITATASEDADTVSAAKDKMKAKVDKVLALAKKEKIDDKDVKTVDFSISPKYVYNQTLCTAYSCPPSTPKISGYTVSESIQIKVRDMKGSSAKENDDRVGRVLEGLANSEITNVYGPNFQIDDEDMVKAAAREEAIAKAKAKAEKLASALGVRLVRIVSFDESGVSPYYYGRGGGGMMAMDSAAPMVKSVDVPRGENKITSNITITYEIR